MPLSHLNFILNNYASIAAFLWSILIESIEKAETDIRDKVINNQYFICVPLFSGSKFT